MSTETDEVYQLINGITTKDNTLNLYEHLQNLYNTKIEMNDDKKFFDLFEDISIRLKKTGTYFNKKEQTESILNYLEEFEKNVKAKKTLLGPLIKIDPSGGDPETITTVPFVPEYHNIFQTLEWAGISIGEKESYMLTNSIRTLAFNKNLPNGAVFWGKIYASAGDYYIAEAVGVESTVENQDPDVEKRNEDGVNKNTYYVTSNLTGDWLELPDVKPTQVRASRLIRYTFSGNLEKDIITNPHFAGKEKDLLRCQIARIMHGTKIEPSVNHWKMGDPESPFKPLEKNEDNTKLMKANEYLELKNWIHFPAGILKQGRLSHYIDNPDADDDERKKFMSKDPFDTRVKLLSEDEPLKSSIPNIILKPWKLTYVYDDKIHINPHVKLPEDPEEAALKDNTVNYSVICIRSLRWPGAYTIRYKGENYFFYFGWGQKFADYSQGEKFVYQDFPIIPRDVDDYEDFPEPNSPPQEPEGQKEVVQNDDD